jgi:Cu/Ag efflux protein CusF
LSASHTRELRLQQSAMLMTQRIRCEVFSFAGACFISTAILSCSERSPEKPSTGSDVTPSAEAADASYIVNGVIESLPRPGKPGSQLIIHHEEIPDFVGKSGSKGMKEMSMPFPLGAGVSLDGLSVGDKVRFDFSVDWSKSPAYWITSIARRDP